MKKFNKILIIIFCLIIALSTLSSFAACNNNPIDEDPPIIVPPKDDDPKPPENRATPSGLTLGEDGSMMMDGKPFYSMGVNYYDMFVSSFYRRWDLSNTFSGLEVLKSYGVKVIRFSTLPFTGTDMGYYFETNEHYNDWYWKKLDALIYKCEEMDIGLMPSLFWTYAVNDYYDEPLNSVAFNENSKTMQFIKEYTEKFVTRYAESPSIYAWEFSNERILASDLSVSQINNAWPMPVGSSRGSVRNNDDRITLDGLQAYYSFFASIVAENDPYDRLICTGDTGPRNTQYQMWKGGSLSMDTRAQHDLVLDAMCPTGITAMSQHQYSNGSLDPVDGTHANLDYSTTWNGLFTYLQEMSNARNLTSYAGEVGYMLEMPENEPERYKRVTKENIEKCYQAIADAAWDTKMPLVLWWNYDYQTNPEVDDDGEEYVYCKGSGVEWSFNERMFRGKLALELIKETNQKFDEYIASL